MQSALEVPDHDPELVRVRDVARELVVVARFGGEQRREVLARMVRLEIRRLAGDHGIVGGRPRCKAVIGEELTTAVDGLGHGRGVAMLEAAGNELLAVPGDLRLDLLADGLADLQFSTDATVSGDVALDVTFGIDIGAIVAGAPATQWFFIKDPTADGERIAAPLKMRLEQSPPTGAVERLVLEFTAFAPGTTELQLFARDAQAAARAGQQRALRSAAREIRMRVKRAVLYHIIEVQPWSRLPERRYALIDYEP